MSHFPPDDNEFFYKEPRFNDQTRPTERPWRPNDWPSPQVLPPPPKPRVDPRIQVLVNQYLKKEPTMDDKLLAAARALAALFDVTVVKSCVVEGAAWLRSDTGVVYTVVKEGAMGAMDKGLHLRAVFTINTANINALIAAGLFA